MPREIKFKVWDKDAKEWVGNGEALDLEHSGRANCFLFDNDSYDIPKNVVWCQFTGLKDKNGKEIYEGDIVKVDELPYEVRFQQGGFWLEDWDNENGWPEQTELKVIGNIYENKELLT